MDRREYVDAVLDAYRATPGTCGAVRRADRVLAAEWFERGVPLAAVENAMVLAAMRRLVRGPDAPPLGTVRSLAYFAPVVEEALVLDLEVGQGYFDYARDRLERFLRTGR